jgi:hypothetical protein
MHLFKRLTSGLVAVALAAILAPTALAAQFYSYCLDAGYADEIALMLEQIQGQTFSGTDAASVRSYIEHFLYRSSFSAVNGGRYPYTNAQGYWAGKTVSDGTYTQVVSATGCYAYSKFVSQVIYGTAGERRDLGESAGHTTADGLKAFLERYAQAGEHIRVDSKHSVTFISSNETGFYYMDYAGDQNPRILLRYSTYSNFASYCNKIGKKVWLYEASAAENTGEPPQVEQEQEQQVQQPAAWLANYAQAAQTLGLTQSEGTLAYSSTLTLAETATFAARVHSLLAMGGVEFVTGEGENWYSPYVTYLQDKQILTQELDYAGATTRDQFVGLLYASVPEDLELGTDNQPVDFADAGQIGDVAAVEAFCRAGILTGVEEEDGIYFYPNALITRGEAIALITRLVLPEYRVGAR